MLGNDEVLKKTCLLVTECYADIHTAYRYTCMQMYPYTHIHIHREREIYIYIISYIYNIIYIYRYIYNIILYIYIFIIYIYISYPMNSGFSPHFSGPEGPSSRQFIATFPGSGLWSRCSSWSSMRSPFQCAGVWDFWAVPCGPNVT